MMLIQIVSQAYFDSLIMFVFVFTSTLTHTNMPHQTSLLTEWGAVMGVTLHTNSHNDIQCPLKTHYLGPTYSRCSVNTCGWLDGWN